MAICNSYSMGGSAVRRIQHEGRGRENYGYIWFFSNHELAPLARILTMQDIE